MVNVCAVNGCGSKISKQRDVRFFPFPKPKKCSLNLKNQWLLEQRRKSWCNAIRREDLSQDQLDRKRICSKHFISGAPADILDVENPDWTPSLHLGCESSNNTLSITILKQWEEMDDLYVKNMNQLSELKPSKWRNKANIVNISGYPAVTTSCDNSAAGNSEDMQDKMCGNCKIMSSASHNNSNANTPSVNALIAEVQKRTEEIFGLRKQVAVFSLDRDAFQDNNEKVKYYTGLPDLPAVLSILEQIEPSLSPVKETTLNNFQKLMLTLIKLRLNVCFRDLAYRFNIDSKSARKVFKHVISVMYAQYKNSIQWPDRESLAANTPICLQEKFKKPDCGSVMVDCFEISAESPDSSLKYTQKYLMSFTPFGGTIFISKGYDGEKTEDFITKDCGILSRLLPGDLVISDRGLVVKKFVPMRKGKLKTSKFKNQLLDPVDVTDIDDMNGVRKVIEHRITEIYEKYKMFRGPVSVPLLKTKCGNESFLDCILHVVCVLVNLCECD